MTSLAYYSKTIGTLAWTAAAADHAAVRRARELLPGIPHLEVGGATDLPEDLRTPRTILVDRPERRTFGRCPGTQGHLCCNYLTVDLYVGCTLGCSYCIMQSYLRDKTIVVQVDDGEAIEQIRAVARLHPGRTVRVGTGEVGDSLLYDPLFDLSRPFIVGLADLPTVRFELKTKTGYVDHLLDVENPGGAVIAFSLNPPEVTQREEGYAASLEERLAAAERVLDAGYGVAFHFDPMIRIERWREAYGDIVARLGAFRDRDVAWISMGTMRFPRPLEPYLHGTSYEAHEFVRSRDGKMRYLQPLRAEMYRTVRSALDRTLPGVPVYLCMESASMWRNVYNTASGGQLRAVRDVLRPVTIQDVVGVDR